MQIEDFSYLSLTGRVLTPDDTEILPHNLRTLHENYAFEKHISLKYFKK